MMIVRRGARSSSGTFSQSLFSRQRLPHQLLKVGGSSRGIHQKVIAGENGDHVLVKVTSYDYLGSGGDFNYVPTAVDFEDPEVSMASKSTSQLLVNYGVLAFSALPVVQRNVTQLHNMSNVLLGKKLTTFLLKHTFFRQFCAGETADDIGTTIRSLRKKGVGGILDYAAEADVDASTPDEDEHDRVVGRQYPYESELQCDHYVSIFKENIRGVHNVSPEGFAAIKLTALGNPKLLMRVSACLEETERFFDVHDFDKSNIITRENFCLVFNREFITTDEDEANAWFDQISGGQDVIDRHSWSKHLSLQDISQAGKKCREVGPLAQAALNEEESKLVINVYHRIKELAEYAHSLDVKLMIDAEQVYFRHFITKVVRDLQNQYNKGSPTIFHTYQCYLKDVHEHVAFDIEAARRGNYHLAAKIVRGAYMVSERQRALEMGYESPIHDNIKDTHKSYNKVAARLITQSLKGDCSVVLATHNQESIAKAVLLMNTLGIDRKNCNIYFAKLLGMADNLSFTLARFGYTTYKYTPYGYVDEVIPYLIRRVVENGDVLSGSGPEKERRMIADRIKQKIGQALKLWD